MPVPAELGGWRRLHPLSPVVPAGAILVGMVLVVLPALMGARASRTGPLVFLAVSILFLLIGVLSWAVTRWRISGDDLQIETGIVRRQSIRIPLSRIQAVDVVAPLTARLLGLAEVRVVSAGRGIDRGRLAYLSAAEAPRVRARLLALAHGLAPETPEPPTQHIGRVDNGQLIISLCLRGEFLVPALAGLAVLAALVAVPRQAAGLGGTAIVWALSFGLGTARLFNDDYDFTIAEAGDGLRLDRGLFQRRHETIPFDRIQAVRLVEPLLWRAVGWCRLEVDVARQHMAQRADRGANRISRTLMPVGTREQATWLLARVLPGASMVPPPGSAPPPRARLKAPLSYHFLATWLGPFHVAARTGRVRASTVVIPLAKVQSVRLSSGPAQRALRLATVHVHTAGRRWDAAATCRDEAEAYGLLGAVPDASRRARRGAPAAAST